MITFEEWVIEKHPEVHEGLGKIALGAISMLPTALAGGAEPSAHTQPTIPNVRYEKPVDTNLPSKFYGNRGFGAYNPGAAHTIKDSEVRDRVSKFMDWRKKIGCENVPPSKADPQKIYQHMDDKEKAELPMEVLPYYAGMVKANPKANLRDQIRSGEWRSKGASHVMNVINNLTQ